MEVGSLCLDLQSVSSQFGSFCFPAHTPECKGLTDQHQRLTYDLLLNLGKHGVPVLISLDQGHCAQGQTSDMTPFPSEPRNLASDRGVLGKCFLMLNYQEHTN